ncbi:hypothetical protein HG535_0A05490 [Zygotorulaspora mrakii]|uniref:ER membrane protein complex subunit 6 n=1 Tax=Zygotorulaspora mrakii TaxID=42260 RepID=A0A7H9AW38_ZYGMR|nr:uncharacterized protein HG535_0A05490 [Zygotorulaspora mrakii]QLG70608.1 hypothetical protein HG535_0A05490 [Zygotorulaspora mrakii]
MAIKDYGELLDSENIIRNKKKLEKLQDSTSLVIGLGAGILQFESLQGFYMFIGSYILIGVLFSIWVCQCKPSQFFQSPVQEIFFQSFFRELTGFVMSWTFSYALIG